MDEPAASVQPGEAGSLRVAGALDQRTVVALRATAQPLVDRTLAGAERVVIEFSGVTRADSAALSLVLHWMRCARAQRCALELRELPGQMLAIARTSRMEQLFNG